jgi:hypothetical protein
VSAESEVDFYALDSPNYAFISSTVFKVLLFYEIFYGTSIKYFPYKKELLIGNF